MSHQQAAQCLIFAPTNKRRRAETVPPTSSEQPEIRGYALLAKSFVSERPEVFEFFSHGDIQVVTKDQDLTNFRTALENGSLGICEIRLDSISPSESRALTYNAPSPFHVQASKHDGGVAQLLRRCDIHVHRFHGNTYTPFISAIDEDNLEVLRNVLPHKMEVSYLHVRGGTVLHYAAKRGEGALVDLLFEKEYSVDTQRLDGLTPLHLAATKGQLEVAKKLLQRGADVNAKATFKRFKDCTPLVLAVRYGHLDVFKWLLNIAPDVNLLFNSDFGRSILEVAVKQRKNSLAFVESILEHQPDVNDKRNRRALLSALCYRLENSDSTKLVVQRMLQYGFKADTEQVNNFSKLLFGAIQKNCIEIVQMSLEMGANVNELQSFPSTGIASFTPLLIAVRNAEENIIRLLISRGANINTRSANDEYPILTAVKNDHKNIVQLLLANGANVWNDSKVICGAAKAGNLEMVELLLSNGASLNSGDAEESVVYSAAKGGNVQLLEALFNNGAQLSPEYLASCLMKYHRYYSLSVDWLIEKPKILQVILDQNFSNAKFVTMSKLNHIFSPPVAPEIIGRITILDGTSSVDNFKLSANILVRHIIKQRMANLSDFDQNVAFMWYSQESIDDFQSACEAELAKIKLAKVCVSHDEIGVNKTTVTFYDILMSKKKQLVGFAKNENIVKAMETEEYKVRFPIFADIIKCQFEKGYHRVKLLKEGTKVVNHLFRNNPAVAAKKINMEIILDYLSNCDLLILNKILPFRI